jgi:hypothetical protein
MSDMIKGHIIAELRIIFRIVPSESMSSSSINIPDRFLTYAQRFDIVPQTRSGSGSSSATRVCPEPSSSLYVLKRAKRTDGSMIGDIVPLHQVRALVDLVPRFYDVAARGLTNKNSSTYSAEFFLNKYFHKEFFWAVHARSGS